MKVKDLRTESNYFDSKTDMNSIIEEVAPKIATVKNIPATVELYKGIGCNQLIEPFS